MLASISPLGERARGSRWSVTVTAHVAGSTVAGALWGAMLGVIGARLPLGDRLRLLLLAVVLALAILAEVVPHFPLPSLRRQVDEDWLHRYRGWVYGAGYGFQLGLGTATIVTTSAIYAAMAAALLTGSVVGAVAIGMTFGAMRGLLVLLSRKAHDPDRLRQVHRRLHRWNRPVWRVAVASEAAALAVTSAWWLAARP